MTDEPSLYDAAGGMAFFEALVGRFYEGVEADPVLRPIYPEADLAGARHRLTLFLAQYWGGPTTYDAGARPPAPPDAPRARSRSGRPSATRGSPGCARRSPGRPRRPRSPTGSTPTSTWPPRRCATATEHGSRRRPAGRRLPGGPGRVDWADEAGGRIGGPDGRGGPGAIDRRTRRRRPRPSAARPSTASPPTPAIASSPRTTPRSRPTSRPRSTRPPRPVTTGGAIAPTTGRARHGRRPRLRQPVRPADRPPRPRAATSTRSCCPHDTPWAEIERRRPKAIILSGGPNSRLRRGRPEARSRRSGPAGSRSSASATAPS